MAGYVWRPSPDGVARANVTRLMRRMAAVDLNDLRHQSVADVARFWHTVVGDLDLVFRAPYNDVLDTRRGKEFARWFIGGRLNIVDSCVRRPASMTPNALAVVHEHEDGGVRTITFSELETLVNHAAAGLRATGVAAGDRVGIYLPMIPEAVIAFYATAAVGAIAVPLFSGFGESALRDRLTDAAPTVVIGADGTRRRGRNIRMRDILAEASAGVSSIRQIVTVENIGRIRASEGEMTWPELLLSGDGTSSSLADLDSEHPLLIGYTSGTTGRPKGAIHTHAGFLVKVASEVAYSFDVRAGDVFCWITDMGWIMGPLSMVGAHANGATLVLYEGSIDTPDHGRLWEVVDRHQVTMLGLSPTLVRSLAANPAGRPTKSPKSVRVLGSTGEPWDPETYDWLARDVFGGRAPVINFSGGTEVGGSFLAPYPIEPIASCSLGGPSLGMDVDVVDDHGHSLRGAVGELVCRQPWPSMTRGIWRDPERYLQAYWTKYPGMWHHGDYAVVQDGEWYIRGRSDDVMNIAGKRVAPAEIESVLIAHPAVNEAAVVGIPDPHKGEIVWAFWTAVEGCVLQPGELQALVADRLGKPFSPAHIHEVAELPKTRSQKIVRRLIRDVVLGRAAGNLDGIDNPSALAAIAEAVGRPLSPT